MKPVVRNIIVTVAAIGVLVGAFLIVFLPTTTQIDISGTFINCSSTENGDNEKLICTLDIKVTTNLIGNANKAEGTVKIGDNEYTLSKQLYLGSQKGFAVVTAESAHKVQYSPLATISVQYDINEVQIHVNAGEHKGYWIAPIEKDNTKE